MRREGRDEVYLLDMLMAAEEVQRFAKDLTWEKFVDSEIHQRAITKSLEIIGEAAGKISKATRTKHTEIPWGDIIGMRNRLIHEYFEIDLRKVWEAACNDIPNLIEQLEPLVPSEEGFKG